MRRGLLGVFFLGLPCVFAATLNSSVLVFHMRDVDRMRGQIDKAVALGNDKLNFVLTLHQVADPATRRLLRLCALAGDGSPTCAPLTQEFIAVFRQKLVATFVYAASLGLDLSVIPHLDDGQQQGFWRNNLVFDPLQRAGEFSYAEALVWPIATALKQASLHGAQVEFEMQGESGATVFHYAASYSTLLRQLRDYFGDAKIKIGVGLNFDLVAGDGFEYAKPQIKNAEKLFAEIDFLGVSAYAPVSVSPRPEDFDASTKSVLRELTALGVRVAAALPFRLSEVGVGGGTLANDGNSTAANPAEAASAPYSGLYGAYTAASNPWTSPEMREFRYEYHAALLEYLCRPELQSQKILSAFLWNSNSWDPQGLYDPGDAYADEKIIDRLRHKCFGIR